MDRIIRGRLDAAPMVRAIRRFVIDERGQDTIEYALLAALVAVLTIPALDAVRSALRIAYLSWNTAMVKCWRMPVPGTGGGC